MRRNDGGGFGAALAGGGFAARCPRQLPGAQPAGRDVPRPRARVRIDRGAPHGRGRRRGPQLHAERRASCRHRRRARGREARPVGEATGPHPRAGGGPDRPRRGDRPRDGGVFHVPPLPARSAAPVDRGGGGGRRRAPRARRVPPGLAAVRRRLELAPRIHEGWDRSGRRRHRIALDRPRPARHRRSGRGGLRAARTHPPGTVAAGRGPDVRASGRLRPGAGGRRQRGPRHGPPAVRGRSRRHMHDLAGQPRSQVRAHDRGGCGSGELHCDRVGSTRERSIGAFVRLPRCSDSVRS